ncbi:LytR/AlgR family response regulator transcription factor [Immundisolibacter sp.]|uniref:LytR/AlgR family response regulator transcription factor n=1 Tax=Immundisolibacter sp. TaxID=1934948 RepID=UPI0035699615
MNILVVDDEPLARARLRRLIEAVPGRYCVGEAVDGVQAVEQCRRLSPDVVLLDIGMPGPDGLATARALADLPRPPAVVFVTAHGEFALDAFETGAVHYLLKPVSAQRLEQALARVTVSEPELRVHGTGCQRRVALSDVLYLRAEAKYVTVHCQDDEWLMEDSLARLAEQYAPALLRIHRAVLVNTRHVVALQRTNDGRLWVQLHGLSEPLPVSRRLATAVQRTLHGV